MDNGWMVIPSKFMLGQLHVAEDAEASLSGLDIGHALERHAQGDWGDVSAIGWAENDHSLEYGGELTSSYQNDEGVKFTLITDTNRRTTRVLLDREAELVMDER